MLRHLVLLCLPLAAVVPSCADYLHPIVDACRDVDCSGNGECKIRGGKAVCVCHEGYQADGQDCVPFCTDGDGDGYGDGADCLGADCDDSLASVFPGATEVCDGRDNDCDGQTDEGCPDSCQTNADCDAGWVCINGFCRFGVCEDYGLTTCAGEECIDTSSSNSHCGSCENACQPGEQCVHGNCTNLCVSASDGTLCDDGLYCTVEDHCEGGGCIGSPRDCSFVDGACMTRICDEHQDACVGEPHPEGTDCDDGLFCNGTDTCDAAGGCTRHSGDPCGDLRCNEFNDTCSEDVWYGLGGSDVGGGISNTQSTHSGDVYVAVDSAGNPMVTWEDNLSGTPELYVKRYDDSVPGGAWVEVGTGSASGSGISTEPGDACCQRLVMDHTDKPVIMWHELTSDDCDIYVKTFDDSIPGGAWVEVGEGSASGFGISGNLGNSHSGWMDLDGDGFPVVAWTITPPGRNNEIYVKRFDGSNWVEMGAGSASGDGISANEGVSFDPHIALDSTGNPFVAWYDETGGSDIYIKKFDGTNWIEVGTGSASGDGITGTGTLNVGNYDVAVDEADNPIVAWSPEVSGNTEIYVKSFNGNNWVEVGAGSASGGGISSSAGDSTWPSLVIDGTGMPVVAWRDDSSGCREVYVKRFNGDSWEEIGEGSATGGGVSNSGLASTKCIGSHNNWSTISLGVGGGRICVAWNQWSDVQRTTMQVYVRCVDE